MNVGVTNEVHGDYIMHKSVVQSTSSQPSTPYGAYTAPVYPPSQQLFMRTSRGSISLVSLSEVDPTKPCSSKALKFEYTIVTQLCLFGTRPMQCKWCHRHGGKASWVFCNSTRL